MERAASGEDRVTLDQPERMNLLGLLMHGFFERNLGDDSVYERVKTIAGDVLVRAGGMAVTLRFRDGGLTIINGDAGSARASVGGAMHDLLGVVVHGKMVWPVLTGRIGIKGNPFLLLKMLPLLRAAS